MNGPEHIDVAAVTEEHETAAGKLDSPTGVGEAEIGAGTDAGIGDDDLASRAQAHDADVSQGVGLEVSLGDIHIYVQSRLGLENVG